MPKRFTWILELAFLAGLSALTLAFVWGHQAGDSPTTDETYHLFAGNEYVADGTYWLNPEHPPLLKLFAGYAVSKAGSVPPSLGGENTVSPQGHYLRWLYGNRLPAHELVALGRTPFPWLAVLLVVLVYGAARRLFGLAAAPLAAVLVALDPTLVAHAAYIHTDAGAALTMTATVVAGLLAARARKLLPWLITGACLGLALATKFTGILLIPVVLGFPFLEALTATEKPPRKALFENVLYAILAVTVGVLLLALTYTVCLRDMPRERAETSIREFLARRGASPELLATSAALCRFSPPLGHYAGGLLGVQLLSSNGRGAANYLHGRVSERGFPLYFPVAIAVKWTPALLLCVALALLLSGRRLFSYETLALALPALLHLAVAIPSSFNIGVRHVLPMVPLLALAASGLLVKRLPARPFLLLTAFLSVSAAFSLWRVHPYEIAYFNVLAGGRGNGAAWLSDSNLDWGQDLARLDAFLKARGIEEQTTIVTYSGLASDYYSRRARVLAPGAPILPGLYAVSASVETLGVPFARMIEGEEAARQTEELLRRIRSGGKRRATIGASFTLWELP